MIYLEAQLLLADDRNSVEEEYVFSSEVSKKNAFEKDEFWGKFTSTKGGSFIPLNLPTAVQTSRSKDDGRYDAGNDDNDPADDVSAEYIHDAVS